MHHGFYVSLDDVLAFYYESHYGTTSYDLPLDAPDLSDRPKSDIRYLAAFLQSLTGPPPDATPPELPPAAPSAADSPRRRGVL